MVLLLSYCTICQLSCVLLLFIYLLISVLNSKRVSGFDQAPPAQALPMVAAAAAAVLPGMVEILHTFIRTWNCSAVNFLISYCAYKLINKLFTLFFKQY